MSEAMGERRLDEIRRLRESMLYPVGLAVGPVIDELLAEVDRLRGLLGDVEEQAVEKYANDLADQARIKSLEIRGGSFDMSLADARELTAAYVASARAMLGDAPNYSETRVDFPIEHVDLEVMLVGETERYVLTVQRAGKVTPHEARVAAEKERDRARELLATIWLYVKWRWVTRQLTTDQKELWADAVDESSRVLQIEDGETPRPVADRWWREAQEKGGRDG